MSIDRRGRPAEWHRETRAWLKWQGLSALALVAAIVIILTVAKVVPAMGFVALVLFLASFLLAIAGFPHLLAAMRIEREAARRRKGG